MINAVEKRALYNLLRMNWLNDPSLAVEKWQVEDYRELTPIQLVERLHRCGVDLTPELFVAYAEECDSPEEFTERLIEDQTLEPKEEDQIYLLIFELWRQLMKEKISLSIFCNELDYQIYLYDQNHLANSADLQNVLLRFSKILEKNVDQGVPANQAIKLISNYCANDIETFLYDFVSEQLDEENEACVQDVLDGFDAYLRENKWFKILRLRLHSYNYSKISQKILEQIIEDDVPENDLDFNLELLLIVAEIGENDIFHQLVEQTCPLITYEENLIDLLEIISVYFQHTDHLAKVKEINTLLKSRAHHLSSSKVAKNDPAFKAITRFFNP